MATYDELQTQKEALVAGIEEDARPILEIDSRSFFERTEWGAINFAEVIDEVEYRLKPLLRIFANADAKALSIGEIQKIVQHIARVEDVLGNIQKFKIEQENPAGLRDQLRSLLLQTIRDFSTEMTTLAQGLEIRALSSEEAQIKWVEIEKEFQSTLSSIQDRQKDADEVLKSMREAAAESGVGRHAEIFSNEVTKLATTAFWWLLATVFLALATAGAAVFIYYVPPAATTNEWVVVQSVVTKIVLLGMLVTATLWCGRNYRALAHESSVNQHRANALSTFGTFVEATEDSEIRNAVLLEATRSIFSQAPSGFLDKHDTSGSETRVLEVVRSMSAMGRSNP